MVPVSARGRRRSGPVRVAITGAGSIAEYAHIPALLSIPDAEIIGLVEPSDARRDGLHARWPKIPLFPDLKALARTGMPQALLVSTPPEHHLEPALWAREHGLHLYLEKPVAASARAVKAIVDAWRGADQVAAVGLNYRFHPGVTELAGRLAAGDIGRTVGIQTVFATPRAGGKWRRGMGTGGGVLFDLGTHHLDLLGFITEARIAEIACVTNSRRSECDTARVFATLSNGCSAQCLFAFGATETDRIEVVGEEGSLHLDRLTGALVHRPLRHGYTRLASIRRATDALQAAFHEVKRARGEPSYRAALAAFVSKIRGQTVALPSLEEGAHVHMLVETAVEASQKGGWIPVSRPPMIETPSRA